MATPQEILKDMEADAHKLLQELKVKRETVQGTLREKILKAYLDDLRSKEFVRLSFCTNPMLSHGNVVHCLLQEDGTAIIESTQSWWAMSYSRLDYQRKGEVFGKVEAEFGYNNKVAHLKCAGLRQGRG